MLSSIFINLTRSLHGTQIRRSMSENVSRSLQLQLRPIEKSGSRHSRHLRRSGKVPGVIYGVDSENNVVKYLVMIDKTTLMKEVRKLGNALENAVYEVNITDIPQIKYQVTMRQAQFHSITGDLFSVNFLIYHPGNRVKIPVDFINEELNEEMKKGYVLIPVTTYIECKCTGPVPLRFEVDVSKTPKKGIFKLDHITLPEGVCFSNDTRPDTVLGVIKIVKG